MNFTMYKLEFMTSVHFGKRLLVDENYSFMADTLFSALYQEALSGGNDNQARSFYDKVSEGGLIFSDALPYIGDTYYLPKPMVQIDIPETEQGNSDKKKEFKKLKYIPADLFDCYMKGGLDASAEVKKFTEELGRTQQRTVAAVRGHEETVPYHVGTYTFTKGSGLYLIVGYKDSEELEIFEELLCGLGLSGIGGRRSAGLGKFTSHRKEVRPNMLRRLHLSGERFMALSVCMANDDALDVVLEDSSYLLVKRSGFIASADYSDEFRRKKDLYVFSAGSCFKQPFDGEIFDVGDGGSHPVYRYAKSMLMEV